VVALVAAGGGRPALSWVVMIVLARRLPPGLAKDLATVLPACVTTARRLHVIPGMQHEAAVTFAQLLRNAA